MTASISDIWHRVVNIARIVFFTHAFTEDKCIANAFKMALKGIESYCCFEIKHIKDNVISLIYSRKGNKNHNGFV